MRAGQKSLASEDVEYLLGMGSRRAWMRLNNGLRLPAERAYDAASQICQTLRLSGDADRYARWAAVLEVAGGRLGHEARLLAAAERGNALRLAGRYQDAESVLVQCLARAGHECRAEVLMLLSPLRFDQMRYRESRDAAQEAAIAYEARGDASSLSRALIKVARAQILLSDFPEAFRSAWKALDSLRGQSSSPAMDLAVLSVAVHCYASAAGASRIATERQELVGRAASLLMHAEPMIAQGEEWQSLHFLWLRARCLILAGGPYLAVAATQLARVWRGLAEMGLGAQSTVAALDLAMLHLQEGRRAQARLIARGALSVLAEMGIPQHADRVLRGLQQGEAIKRKEVAKSLRMLGAPAWRPLAA